jgi:pimeloyl-ACP methyl ester carboxylesterase
MGGDGFTIQRHIADAVAFVRALSSGLMDLLGLSRGGHIAFRIAQYHPTPVHALVLADLDHRQFHSARGVLNRMT